MNLIIEPVDLVSKESVQELLKKRSGLYLGKTMDGEEFFMLLKSQRELTIRYFRSNERVKVHTYDSDGMLVEERFEKVQV